MPIRISGSTGISGLDGSATTPVLQGASANSGIHYSGNTVFVSTSGTKALTIGPTGNVSFANSSVSIGGQTISAYSGMMKNRIINGDFRIDQRFAGAANNNIAGSQYTVDRWFYGVGNLSASKMRFQQNNTNGPGQAATQAATGFPNYFGCNVVSSNTVSSTEYIFLSQVIEGFNTADLAWGTANASPVTLSFWSYSSVPGTHGGTITSGIDSSAYPFTYTINTANTWQFQTITISGPTSGVFLSNNSAGLVVYFISGALGSNYTRSNTFTWAATSLSWPTGAVNVVSSANGSFYLTGVQLEKGSQATAFDFRHYTTELQLCQRYYSKSYDIGTAPGTATQLNLVGGAFQGAAGLGGAWGSVQFPVIMRSSPTVTLWDGAGTLNTLSYTYGGGGTTQPILNGGAVWGAGGAFNIGTYSFFFRPSSAQASALSYTHYAASAEFSVQN